MKMSKRGARFDEDDIDDAVIENLSQRVAEQQEEIESLTAKLGELQRENEGFHRVAENPRSEYADLINRLRERNAFAGIGEVRPDPLSQEAADAIERMLAR
jgi:predicted RNase H-like nuclease (RuvC/YqgF family)